MKRGLFITALILLSGLFTSAQTSSVSGRVYDKNSHEPLSFASLCIAGTSTLTVSDMNGYFRIPVPVTTYKVRIIASFIGYKTDTLPATAGKPIAIYLEPANGTLQEVVISGTMKESSRMDSPVPVEVYHPTFFKKNPSPNIFESLNMVNGVQPQLNCNVCNTGDIHINGMEGPYTMILIDGMPIVSSLSSVYGLSGIPQSMIKRVEIVKGPAAALYGSEAVGGLINIITKDAYTAPVLQTDVSGSSVGEINTDIAARKNFGENISTLLGVNYFNYWQKWDVNNDNFTDVTLQNRVSVFNKWNFVKRSGKIAALAARYVYENRWGGELQWTPKWRGTDSIYGESIYTNRAELIGNFPFTIKKEDISFTYSYNYHLQDSYYGINKYFAGQHTGFGQFLWQKKIKNHFLTSGSPFRFIYYDDNSPATAEPDTVNQINKPSYTYLPGVFLQDEITVTKKLTTLAGIRWDHHNIQGNIWSPRLSFKYSPDSSHTFRLSGGNGFRVVNIFTEDHMALSGARIVEIREDLKPERSWNANLNYLKQIPHKTGFIGIDASLFYTYFTNKIVADLFTDPDKIIYDNLKGHAVSQGGTVNIDLSFTNGLKLIGGFTLMDVYQVEKDTAGNWKKLPQLYAPRVSGTFALSYTFKKAGILADLTGNVKGPMYLPVVPNDFRPDRSPTFCLLNLQLTKKFKNGFELYAGAKNLLNFIPKDPILRPFDPFDKEADDPVTNPYGYRFDPSYNYAPVQGIKGFLGLRWSM